MQLIQVPAHQVAHFHILEVIPPPFIPGIQIGSVGWQGLQPHLSVRPRHELLDRCSAGDRGTIPDHQQTPPRHLQQVSEKLNTMPPIQRLLPRQSVDPAQGRHSTHDRQVISCQFLPEDRRLPMQKVTQNEPGWLIRGNFIHDVFPYRFPVSSSGRDPACVPGDYRVKLTRQPGQLTI